MLINTKMCACTKMCGIHQLHTIQLAATLKMTSQERLELHANIKFCMELGETPTDTYIKLQRTRGENAVSRALVFKWFRRLSDGRKSLEDDEGRGRRSSVKPSDVTSIEDTMYYQGGCKSDRSRDIRSNWDELWKHEHNYHQEIELAKGILCALTYVVFLITLQPIQFRI
jgi:hypothetical protein